MEGGNIPHWTPNQVADWLRSKGHSEDYINTLCHDQRVDGKSLLLISESDLRQPPVNITILGDVKRLYYDIAELQQNYLQKNASFFSTPADVSFSHSDDWNYKRKHMRKKRKVNFDSTDSQISDSENVQHQSETKSQTGYAKKQNLKPEFTKALLAMAYVFVVTWITALVMVIVHDRVPDMEKYPPLPDLFLDNMPHIPWAFEMCEVTGTILFTIWVGVLVFHKYRFILMRRFFALSGTVFLLRCVTMLITSLSVPGTHLQCNPRVMLLWSHNWTRSVNWTLICTAGFAKSGIPAPYGDWISRLYNAYLIWKGAGMSIQGVRTCGDYMFSGHTVALTMLNFFITEYTSRRLYFVHTFSWLLNMFGIFFILAAHEHYSIDVFIAFYITSRLFLYYHTLANNQALMQRDYKRTKIWFPLFSYFESGVDGIVPNQYEWPITPRRVKFLLSEVYTNLKKNLRELFQINENVRVRMNLFRVRKKD